MLGTPWTSVPDGGGGEETRTAKREAGLKGSREASTHLPGGPGPSVALRSHATRSRGGWVAAAPDSCQSAGGSPAEGSSPRTAPLSQQEPRQPAPPGKGVPKATQGPREGALSRTPQPHGPWPRGGFRLLRSSDPLPRRPAEVSLPTTHGQERPFPCSHTKPQG